MKAPQIIKRFASWLNGIVNTPPSHRRNKRTASRNYTGIDSLTQRQIIGLLKEHGWMSQKEIRARLNVTSIGMHLALMIQNGLVIRRPATGRGRTGVKYALAQAVDAKVSA